MTETFNIPEPQPGLMITAERIVNHHELLNFKYSEDIEDWIKQDLAKQIAFYLLTKGEFISITEDVTGGCPRTRYRFDCIAFTLEEHKLIKRKIYVPVNLQALAIPPSTINKQEEPQ